MPPLAAGPARWIRLPLIALAAVSAAWMFSGAATLFSDDLSRLNPLPRDLLDLDIRLRGDLGAPDVRRLVAVTGDSAQAVLEKSNRRHRCSTARSATARLQPTTRRRATCPAPPSSSAANRRCRTAQRCNNRSTAHCRACLSSPQLSRRSCAILPREGGFR
jgi:predicted exporter